jgi:hypothetical protein
MNGALQVAYDDTSGKRMVLTITDRSIAQDAVLAAVQDGTQHKSPLRGLLLGLSARKIRFDMPPAQAQHSVA